MNLEQARELLDRLARGWSLEILLESVLDALAAVLLLAALLPISGTFPTAPGTGLWFVLILGALLAYRRPRFGTRRRIARHLDRTQPALQDSCELVLAPPPENLLGRLQQQRVLAVLQQLPESSLLPRQGRRKAAKRCAAAAGLALVLILLVPGPRPTSIIAPAALAPAPASVALQPQASLRIESIEISVQPPGYTGQPAQTVAGLDVQAPEGSRLRWLVRLDGDADPLVLVFGDGERQILQASGPRTYSLELQVWASKVYSLEGSRQGRILLRSDYGRLAIRKDQPPNLRVLEPPTSTLMDPNELRPLALAVQARDDYALTQAQLVLTLTSGSGESVQFREQRLPLPLPAAAPATATLESSLDPNALGMQPGDELYFHVEATDNRQPEPNRARSETCFLRIRRLTEPPRSGTEGLLINPVPEYFRSQRQIIIDTEKLIADKPRIPKTEHDQRSNSLGLDQRLLRLRYGTLAGDEFESGRVVSEAEAHVQHAPGEAGDEDHGSHQPGEAHSEEEGHDHAQGPPPEMVRPNQAAAVNPMAGVPDEYVHRHDSAETATYFPNQVRATLKSALAQMWQAEMYLRTNQPELALPYEYEALRLLKELQEADRVYVERVGFDPPPLKPDEARLSGDLTKIAPGTAESQRQTPDPAATLRETLQALQDLRLGQPLQPEAAASLLQRAGQELALQAPDQPGFPLEALGDLRRLSSELAEGKPVCQECIASAEKAFWRLLPPARAAVGDPQRPRSIAFQAYQERQP